MTGILPYASTTNELLQTVSWTLLLLYHGNQNILPVERTQSVSLTSVFQLLSGPNQALLTQPAYFAYMEDLNGSKFIILYL